MMNLGSIDHIHVYVNDREAAEVWFSEVLGLTRVKSLEIWAKNGPLTLGSKNNQVHLALFESDSEKRSNVAFKVSGDEFPEWISHLKKNNVEYEVKDHDLAWSVYFRDLFGNDYEITSYDHEVIGCHFERSLAT